MKRWALRPFASAVVRAAHYARRRWALLAFVAILTGYRATQWGHFAVPAPDFFDFEDAAQALAHGHLPAQFQRAPLYPALIAIFTPLAGGARPALAAAQGLNLALSAAALVLMYELCALFVGRMALLVVMLSGLHWTMAYVTVHPLCEPALLAAIVAALYLDASGRRGKYVAAGLAAATRYEGLFLIGALALGDVWRRRDVARAALAAGIAAAPAGAWLVIGLLSTPNPYAQVIASQTPAGSEFLRSMAMSAIGALPVQVLYGALAGSLAAGAVAVTTSAAMAALTVLGARRLLQSHRDSAAPLLLFGGAYTAIHLVYAAANTRFTLPVLWLVQMLALMGVIDIAQWARARWRASKPWHFAMAGLIPPAAGAGAIWAARYDPLWVALLSAPVALGLTCGKRPISARALVAGVPLVAFLAAGALGLGGWYLDRESRWWAELTPAARWCDEQRSEPVRLAATRPVMTLLREICPRPRVRFYDLAHLDARDLGAAALPPDVTHLLWCSTDTPAPDQRPPLLLSHRYADERERLLPTGRWFARRVARGAPGWRVCARFEARGQEAVIYARDETRQARASAEVER